MKSLKSAGILVAGSALAVGLMATPASAADYIKNAVKSSGAPTPSTSSPCSWPTVRGQSVGQVCFEPYGDRFWIKDLKADGAHIEVRAIYSGNPQTVFQCKSYATSSEGWAVCDFSDEMREDQGLNFTPFVVDGTTIIGEGTTAWVPST